MNTLSIRQMVAAVLLAIFTFANYAVQTHVHEIPHAIAVSAQAVTAPSPGSPIDNDAQHCPLCQEFLSGGSFLTPAVVIVCPILILAGTVILPVVRVVAHSRSHGWQGRGPPSV